MPVVVGMDDAIDAIDGIIAEGRAVAGVGAGAGVGVVAAIETGVGGCVGSIGIEIGAFSPSCSSASAGELALLTLRVLADD